MNILNRIKTLFGKGEQRVAPSSIEQGVRFLLQDFSNKDVNEEDILKAVHSEPAFWACINVMATSVASAEYYVSEMGTRIENHPIEQLLNRPNEFHNRFTFFWVLTAYLLSLGSVYVLKLPNNSLIPLSPTKVTQQNGGSYRVQFGSTTINDVELNKNLAYISLPDLRQPYTSGTGYGSVLAKENAISKAAASHEAGYLENHARPDMIINYQDLSGEQVQKIEKEWKSKHKGLNNAGKTAFSNAKGVDVIPFSTSFKELGLIELRKFSRETVQQTFAIPPELLGNVENSNRSTIDAADYLFKKNSVTPLIINILAEFNIHVLPMLTTKRGIQIEHESVVPEDREFKFSVMKAFPNCFMINEARALADARPVKNGNRAIEGDQVFEEEEASMPIRKAPLMRMGQQGSKLEQLHMKKLYTELNESTRLSIARN